VVRYLRLLIIIAGLALLGPGSPAAAQELRLGGHIQVTETNLAFLVAGRLTEVKVSEGDDVKMGQVVAELDKKLLAQEVEAAQGALDAADADPTPKPKKLKDAELKQARAALESAKLRLGYATLTSPLAGVVLTRAAQPGEVVAVGMPIVTVADLDTVWFEGFVPEPDLGRLRLGQKAEVKSDSFPDQKFLGTVHYISPKAEFTPKTVETYKERITLVYRTKIKLANPERRLKKGMPAEAVVYLDHR
jgi:multidrug efflux pump subunit AcrA (membrane-fusion protein)